MQKERKCYNCRKIVKGKKMLCTDCINKPIKTTSTFVIFDKI